MGAIRRSVIVLSLLAAAVGPATHAQTGGGSAGVPSTVDPFRIGPGDVLRVVVWGEPQHSLDIVRVRPDGFITLPLLDDIRAAGLMPTELRDRVRDALAKFVKDPAVTVMVSEINSYRVFVLGEVASQGVLTFSRPTRLLQAIATAGGLTEFSKREVVLIREGADGEIRTSVDLKKLMAGDARVDNPVLEPNDTLLVY